jgi:hypothetical protein
MRAKKIIFRFEALLLCDLHHIIIYVMYFLNRNHVDVRTE